MIRLETHEGVAIITLDSAPVNALSITMLEELDQTLQRLESPEVRGVILTGSGKCFSAGLDLKEVRGLDRTGRETLVETLNRCLERLYRFPRPVVAAVNGHAIAGGMVLLLAADHRICVDANIKIGLAEVRVGIPFPMGALAIVQNELDAAGRRLFVLLGLDVDPQEAHRLHVVDELVSANHPMRRAQEVAGDLATLPHKAFAAIKQHLRGAAADRIRAVRESGLDPVFDAWEDGFPM